MLAERLVRLDALARVSQCGFFVAVFVAGERQSAVELRERSWVGCILGDRSRALGPDLRRVKVAERVVRICEELMDLELQRSVDDITALERLLRLQRASDGLADGIETSVSPCEVVL